MRKYLLALLPSALLSACLVLPFRTEGGFVVQSDTGLYVHREVELRVDARRFRTPPPNAPRGATSKLKAMQFTSVSVSGGGFPDEGFERQGNYLVWREAHHLRNFDLKGHSALGAQIEWEKPNEVTAFDTLEMFPYPQPDAAQIDNWSPWMDAGSRRDGDPFAWHTEVNGGAAESVAKPAYPFQMRHRLRLSRRWNIEDDAK